MFGMNKKTLFLKLSCTAMVLLASIFFTRSMNSYYLTLINVTMIYFLCTASMSLILGMGGQMSFCAVTFMGLGSFITAKASTVYAQGPVVSLLLGVALAMLTAFLFGLVLMKMQGAFFTFGTIGLVNIGATVYQNLAWLSGGSEGTKGIPKLTLLGYTFATLQTWFYLLVFILLLVFLFMERIRNSSLGRGLMAIRDDEVTAQTLGIDVYRTKVIAFTLSSGLAALSGTLVAFHNGVVSPSLFTFGVQLKFIIMVMLGGVNSTFGTLLGTGLVQLLPEYLRFMQNYAQLIYGIGIILLMIFMPTGIAGLWEMLFKKCVRLFKLKNPTKVKRDVT